MPAGLSVVVLGRFGLWALLLPLLMLRGNRNLTAAAVVAVTGFVQIGSALAADRMGSESGQILAGAFAAFPIGLGALFLLTPVLGRLPGALSGLPAYLAVAVPGAFLLYLLYLQNGLPTRILADGMAFFVFRLGFFTIWSAIAVASLSGAGGGWKWNEGRELRPRRVFRIHLACYAVLSVAVWVVVAMCVTAYFAPFDMDGGSQWPVLLWLLLTGAILGAGVYLLLVAYLALFLTSPFYREQVERFFGAAAGTGAGAHEAQPCR